MLLLGAIAAGWVVQIYLTYMQRTAFNRTVAASASTGTVAVGGGRQALPRRPGVRGDRRRRPRRRPQRRHPPGPDHVRPQPSAAGALRRPGQPGPRGPEIPGISPQQREAARQAATLSRTQTAAPACGSRHRRRPGLQPMTGATIEGNTSPTMSAAGTTTASVHGPPDEESSCHCSHGGDPRVASEPPTLEDPGGFFGVLAHAAECFIGLFQAGGEVFLGLVTGIIPLLVVLLTAVNALIRLIGPERIDKLGEAAGRPGPVVPGALPRAPGPVGLLPDQPDGLHDGSLPSRALQAGVLRLRGQLRAPDHRAVPARQPRRALRLPRDRGRHHHARRATSATSPSATCSSAWSSSSSAASSPSSSPPA